MKLNNKGISIIEIVLTFSLIMIMVIGMIGIVFNYREKASISMEKLDMDTFNSLAQKHEFINKDTYYWPDNITGLVYDFGDLLINKVNKSIDGDTIFKAVENVYRNSYNYSEEDLFLKLEEVRKENIERQNKNFPSRYRINQEGTSEVLYDENKFEGRKL